MEEELLSCHGALQDFSKQTNTLKEDDGQNIVVGSKLLQAVQQLVLYPKNPEVKRFLNPSMTDRKFTPAEIRDHSDGTSCWIIIHDRVYDVTEFVSIHPGGEEIILENAGGEATSAFESKGHSSEAYGMLDQYCIGIVDRGENGNKAKFNSQTT